MPTNTAIALARPYAEDAELPGRRASAFELVRHLLWLNERVSTLHRREMLGTAVWKWTEAEGVPPYRKYHVRRRSTGALDLSRPASVNHKHVWPRKWIIDQLLAKASWSDEELWTFLAGSGEQLVKVMDQVVGHEAPPSVEEILVDLLERDDLFGLDPDALLNRLVVMKTPREACAHAVRRRNPGCRAARPPVLTRTALPGRRSDRVRGCPG